MSSRTSKKGRKGIKSFSFNCFIHLAKITYCVIKRRETSSNTGITETESEDEKELKINKAFETINSTPKPITINKMVGGIKKIGKIEVNNVDNKFKMLIGGEFTTLTEQDIDIDDETIIKRIHNRKYMRYYRKNKKS